MDDIGAGEGSDQLGRAEALSDLLERAEAAGDDLLATAVYHAATRRGLRDVADAYLESRPKDRQRWDAYVEVRAEAGSLEGLVMDAFPPPKPPEIGR